MRNKKLSLTILFILSAPAYAWEVSGRVVSVADGDTITVLDSAKVEHRIRLNQIDAPEKRQAWGARSKQSLSDLVFGRAVAVDVATRDRYGREVGTVFANGVDVNLEQVKRGMAWVYRQYARDPAYYAAEQQARTARLGLWADKVQMPPWEFRRAKR